MPAVVRKSPHPVVQAGDTEYEFTRRDVRHTIVNSEYVLNVVSCGKCVCLFVHNDRGFAGEAGGIDPGVNREGAGKVERRRIRNSNITARAVKAERLTEFASP